MRDTVVVFIGGYLPAKKYGGPVTSIANLVANLGDCYDVKIVSNDHDLNETRRLDGIQDGWNRIGKADVLYIPESAYSQKHFEEILKETKAKAIYLSSIFYYSLNLPAIRAAKKLDVAVILAPRGELCDNALMLGKIKKRAFIAMMNLLSVYGNVFFHATSEEEKKNTIRYLHVPEDHVFLMPNMSGTVKERKNKEKRPGELKMVFLARIQEKKNLLTAIQAACQANGRIQFDIYGPLEQPQYWQQCQHEMEKAPDNVHIEYKGAVDPQEAKSIFANYHCFIFPTLSENYGHVIAESLLCGCPVILSKGTTPWDDLDHRAGRLVALGDISGFTASISQMAAMDQTEFAALQNNIDMYLDEKLKINELKQQYMAMFDTAIREG